MASFDYGDPVGHAISAYTTLQSADLAKQEFEHRKSIDDQTMQMNKTAHDQATTTFTNAQNANKIAGIQAELRNSNGAPSAELLDRAFEIDPSLKQYLDPKFSNQRKADIDKAMSAFGDLVKQQEPAQQQAIANPVQGEDGPMTALPQLSQTPAPAQATAPAPQAIAPAAPQSAATGYGDEPAPAIPSAVNTAVAPATPAATPAAPNEYGSKVIAKNQLLGSMTDIFKDRLLAGTTDDGQPPKDAQIVDFHSSPDGKGVALEVQFTRQDGTTYNAPITENRSADPKDPVKFLSVQTLVDRMATERALISGLDAARAKYGDKEVIGRMDAITTAGNQRDVNVSRNAPLAKLYAEQGDQLEAEGDKYGAAKKRTYAAQFAAGNDAKEIMELEKGDVRPPKFTSLGHGVGVNNNSGAIVGSSTDQHYGTQVLKAPKGATDASGNPVKEGTSVYMNSIGGKLSYAPAVLSDATGGSKTSKLPADAQMVEYMVTNGIAPDKKTAYDLVKHTKENPEAMILKLAQGAIHARDTQYLNPEDKGYKTNEDIIKESTELVNSLHAQKPSAIQPATPAQPPAKTQTVTDSQLHTLMAQSSGDKNTIRATLKASGYTHYPDGTPIK